MCDQRKKHQRWSSVGFSVHLPTCLPLPPAPAAVQAELRSHHESAGHCHTRPSANPPYPHTISPHSLLTHPLPFMVMFSLSTRSETRLHFSSYHCFEHKTMLSIFPWEKVKDYSTLKLIDTYKAKFKTCGGNRDMK